MNKRILAVIAGIIGLVLAAYAQSVSVTAVSLTGGTPANVLSGRYVADSMYFVNQNTSNAATIKFYDSANTNTYLVRPAYTSVDGYATNYNTVYTNAAGVLATNSFTGWYTYTVSNAAVTNERPRLATVIVPANSSRALPVQAIVANGLTVLSDQTGSLEVTYRAN